MSKTSLAVLMVVTGAVASLAHAEVAPIIDFTGGGAVGVITGGNATAGFVFNVTTATTISGLGIFDVGENGLINSHQVGLWNSTGTLLASATLNNSANAVASTSSLGDWLETDITALTLDPGSYVLGASYLNVADNTEDDAGYRSTASSVSGVTYGSAVIEVASDFADPTDGESLLDAGAFGPMAFTDSTATPEPASFGLGLGALAFCGIAFRLRIASKRS